MAGDDHGRRRHFILEGTAQPERFRGRKGGGDRNEVPVRDRPSHGASLLGQLTAIKPAFTEARKEQERARMDDGFGLQLEFASFPDVALAFEKLEASGPGIELLNVRHGEDRTLATVFVPDGALSHFEQIVEDYLTYKTSKTGEPRDRRKLIDAIDQVRRATLEALWTDDEPLPDDHEAIWWEVWLHHRDGRDAALGRFVRQATHVGLHLGDGVLDFPERTVVLARGTPAAVRESMLVLNSVAELRRNRSEADLVGGLRPSEEVVWVDDLLDRTTYAPPAVETPRVCLLDTGLNSGHPLLAPATMVVDLHTVDPAWGVADSHGHGTALAGLALFGDLELALASPGPVDVPHRIESVKILRRDGDNEGGSRHHGWSTTEAVARPEVSAPALRRVFVLATTTDDERHRGRPTAWSSAVDRLAAGVEEADVPRLLIVSAGNVRDPAALSRYPGANAELGIQEPAQAWNVLTVGAMTERVQITEDEAHGYVVVAPRGGLSPYSRSSVPWISRWPLKPDVVFEGGNAARDRLGAIGMASLHPVTTHYIPLERLLTTANATSAATALAARMAAGLMAAYPGLRPETIRGLLVHSADWTETMLQQFLPESDAIKRDHVRLVRHCGFGAPSLDRAQWTLGNSLTLVVESELAPLAKNRGKVSLGEMHLHELPWPADALLAIGEVDVELRVTLSYFVEPNPSARGAKSRYAYASHGLRFDVRRPAESTEAFRARVNLAVRDEVEGRPSAEDDPRWLLGTQARHKGSLHSDIWRGPAAELARRNVLAVYPVGGWWKTRPAHRRYGHSAPYSLLVSIRAPEVDVDLCTEIETRIAASTEVPA